MLEVQITQTRHPKSVADRCTDGHMNGRTDGWMDRESGLTTRPAFTKGRQVKRLKCFYLLE